VRDAIAAGIVGDLGSGSNVDICIITKQKAQLLRPFDSRVVELHTAADHAGLVTVVDTLTTDTVYKQKSLKHSKNPLNTK